MRQNIRDAKDGWNSYANIKRKRRELKVGEFV